MFLICWQHFPAFSLKHEASPNLNILLQKKVQVNEKCQCLREIHLFVLYTFHSSSTQHIQVFKSLSFI